MRDLDTVRYALTGSAILCAFDLPWTPVFVIFVYMLHPWLGALTIGGAVLLTFITILTELLTDREELLSELDTGVVDPAVGVLPVD